MDSVFVIIFPALIAIGIANNFIYLKKLKSLLVYLQSNHGDKLENWNISADLLDFSPVRTKSLVKFLKSPEYFNDENVKNLKINALTYLRSGYIIFGTLFIVFAFLFIIDFISKK